MIEFAVVPLGQKLDIGCCGPVSSPSRMYYPSIYFRPQKAEIKIPDTGEAKIRYKVTNRETVTRDGETKHSASIDVLSIESPPASMQSR